MSEHLPPMPPRSASLMNRLIGASLAQRFLVALLALVLVGAGIRALQRLPVDAYPDLSPPSVDIVTQWPGHTAEEVERLITVPVERGMTGIPKTTSTRSVSLYGLSDVTLNFANGSDYAQDRQEVFNRLGDLELPDGTAPSVSPMSSSERRRPSPRT